MSDNINRTMMHSKNNISSIFRKLIYTVSHIITKMTKRKTTAQFHETPEHEYKIHYQEQFLQD